MKALVYEGINHVKIEDVKEPKLEKHDDIIIKVTSAAICGSDLHLLHGMVPGIPKGHILGHETMGIVEEAGPLVYSLKKGDRVIIPFPVACGSCWYCENDLYSQCNHSYSHGAIGAIFGSNKYGSYDGGQAEYLRVPFANAGPKIIPEELTDEQVLLITDVLPTACWGVDVGGVKKGDTVAILGCGPIGLTAIKWAILAGARRIIAVDYINYRLEHAGKYNGVETVKLEQNDTGEYIYEMTSGGADVVIDCVGIDTKLKPFDKLGNLFRQQNGSKSAIEIAAQAVRKGGTVVFLGVYGNRYNMFPLGDFFAKNITLKMGQCPVYAYVDRILQQIKEKRFDPTDIITHKLSLKEGARAYELFDKKEDNCIKVILKP